jgi:hypothetical protein
VLRRTASWLKVALSLLTAAGLGAAAWAYFVTPEKDTIRVVGYGSAPLVVGKKVVMNLGLFSPDRKKVVGIYTVRYVDRVPVSIYERKGLEDGIWQDFTSKNLGPGIGITVLGGQPVTVEQSSELPASEYVVEHLLKYGAAVYLMGRFHTEGRSQERQYCVYALYNPPRIGVCVEHN